MNVPAPPPETTADVKTSVLILAIAVAGIAGFWLATRRASHAPRQPAQPAVAPVPLSGRAPLPLPLVETPSGPAPEEERADGAGDMNPPGSDAPAVPASADLPADRAMEALRTTLRNYGQRFKGNPVGNNAEITAALNGDNPRQAIFIDPAIHAINGRGELVDAWGTPYFFHQLSGMEMEIRSAGADRTLWTADDLLAR
jgi:hypothetical protein